MSSYTPTKRGGGRKRFWGSFYVVALAILKGGGLKKFPLFKRGGGAKGLTLSWGEGRTKCFKPAIFPLYTPLPVINDQSLRLD